MSFRGYAELGRKKIENRGGKSEIYHKGKDSVAQQVYAVVYPPEIVKSQYVKYYRPYRENNAEYSDVLEEEIKGYQPGLAYYESAG